MQHEPLAVDRARREYDSYAPLYDRETGWYERIMLGDGRTWACSQARGSVLEVAIGTGRNLPHYPPGIKAVGIDLSWEMLARARTRGTQLESGAELVQADAARLPFSDCAFDTLICTLGLSSMPDDQAAVAEMYRVLRRAGHLVMFGHVASPHRPLAALQRLTEQALAKAARPTDRQTREVASLLHRAGFAILYRHRARGGVIERVTAMKP